MLIRLNNVEVQIEKESSLSEVLDAKGYDGNQTGRYAVALNRQFIARAHYHQTLLKEHDVLEIIRPMQGG